MTGSASLTETVLALVRCSDRVALAAQAIDAAARLVRPDAVGLYLFESDDEPVRGASRGVPRGFLEEYEAELRARDPVLRHVCRERQAALGRGLLGAAAWSRSDVGRHLDRWGFACNLQAPLLLEGRVVGTLNAAAGSRAAPLGRRHLQRIETLASAASIALAHIRELERAGRALPGPSAASRVAPRAAVAAAADEQADPRPPRDCSVDALAALAPRAGQVARLLCEGASNKTIARALGISPNTVKDHVSALCRRAGARNRTDFVHRLLRPD